MANGRCRMHGGRSPGAPTGKQHPGYRHGRRTKEAYEGRRHLREARTQIRALNELIRRI
jgi:hypothetical protein